MRMDDATWRRHANPWSVWTCATVLPVIIFAVWSRVWIGRWRFLGLPHGSTIRTRRKAGDQVPDLPAFRCLGLVQGLRAVFAGSALAPACCIRGMKSRWRHRESVMVGGLSFW